jgi:uncharacterized protein
VWRLALHAQIDDALDRTPLPAAPDVTRVDSWLRSVRARSVAGLLGRADEAGHPMGQDVR